MKAQPRPRRTFAPPRAGGFPPPEDPVRIDRHSRTSSCGSPYRTTSVPLVPPRWCFGRGQKPYQLFVRGRRRPPAVPVDPGRSYPTQPPLARTLEIRAVRNNPLFFENPSSAQIVQTSSQVGRSLGLLRIRCCWPYNRERSMKRRYVSLGVPRPPGLLFFTGLGRSCSNVRFVLTARIFEFLAHGVVWGR